MEVVNLIVTIVSIICTVVSIIYSVKATRAAKDAKNIKNQVRATLYTISLKEFVDSYNYAKQIFLKETRSDEWFKGKDPNTVITPFDDVLSRYTSLDTTVCREDIKAKIRELKKSIQDYYKISKKRKKELISLAEIIAEELGTALNENISLQILDE